MELMKFKPTILFIGLTIFFFGCENKTSQLNQLSLHSYTESLEKTMNTGSHFLVSGEVNELKVDDNHQLQFTYEIQPSDNDPNRFSVNAEIKNTGSTPFYFLSESCNGLDYYIEAEPSAAQVEIIMHCNVTYPKRIEILPHQSFAFKSRLRIIGTCENARLKLMLIVLEKDELLDGKSISDFRLKSSHKTVQLIGPSIAL